jgi:hypothetical protein
MESLITAPRVRSKRVIPLGALNRVALRDECHHERSLLAMMVWLCWMG